MQGQTGKVRVYDLCRAPLSAALIYRSGRPRQPLLLIILSWLPINENDRWQKRENKETERNANGALFDDVIGIQ